MPVLALAASTLLLGLATPASAGELFLVDGTGLYAVDTDTAEITLVGAGACDGLALSPEPSRYLYCTRSREAGDGFLYALETDGHHLRYVATIDGDADRGLTFNAFDGLLYGTDNQSFGVIDPMTGTFTPLASPPTEPESLAADPIDNLVYGVDRSEWLIVYDVGTDSWSTVGATGIDDGGKGGLAFDPGADLLYFVETDGDLYRVNPADASTALVGTVPGMDEFAGLTFLPQYDPVPDIKANGRDEPLLLRKGRELFLTIDLDGGEFVGDKVELWILAETPGGWQYFDPKTGVFVNGFAPSRQGALFEMDARVVWDNSKPLGLSIGLTTFYFGVDMVVNGVFDEDDTFLDSVRVRATSF